MLAAHWNGHTWSPQHAAIPTGARGAELNGVACSSKIACTAVGGYGMPLAERWNGG
jgi:hypothetical protein